MCIYIWVNYNISLTWNKAILGWFLLLTMIPVRSQWGRYNLPRYIMIYIYIIIFMNKNFHPNPPGPSPSKPLPRHSWRNLRPPPAWPPPAAARRRPRRRGRTGLWPSARPAEKISGRFMICWCRYSNMGIYNYSNTMYILIVWLYTILL